MGTYVGDMTWLELKEYADRDYVLILPVGSTEQHGPHLPLSTDEILSLEIANGVAGKINAVVAPPIRYGYYSRPKSGGGEGFPGTTSLSSRTLIATVTEVLKGFSRHGFHRFLVLNGHYENIAILPEAVEDAVADLAEPGKPRAIVMSWSDAVNDDDLVRIFGSEYPGAQTDHASVSETSLMLYVRPELVRKEKLPNEKVQRITRYDIIPAPEDTITRSGSLWSAVGSSREKGELLFTAVVGGIAGAVSRDLK